MFNEYKAKTPTKQVPINDDTSTKQFEQRKTKLMTTHEGAEEVVNTYYNTHFMSP